MALTGMFGGKQRADKMTSISLPIPGGKQLKVAKLFLVEQDNVPLIISDPDQAANLVTLVNRPNDAYALIDGSSRIPKVWAPQLIHR